MFPDKHLIIKVSNSDRGLLAAYQSDSKIIFLFLKQKIIEIFKIQHDFLADENSLSFGLFWDIFSFAEKKVS